LSRMFISGWRMGHGIWGRCDSLQIAKLTSAGRACQRPMPGPGDRSPWRRSLFREGWRRSRGVCLATAQLFATPGEWWFRPGRVGHGGQQGWRFSRRDCPREGDTWEGIGAQEVASHLSMDDNREFPMCCAVCRCGACGGVTVIQVVSEVVGGDMPV
jgi:hypothetical protein